MIHRTFTCDTCLQTLDSSRPMLAVAFTDHLLGMGFVTEENLKNGEKSNFYCNADCVQKAMPVLIDKLKELDAEYKALQQEKDKLFQQILDLLKENER